MKTYTLEQMLAYLRAKSFTGRGIGFATSYIQTVVDAAGFGAVANTFAGKSAADVKTILKAAGDKLVCRCSDAVVVAVTKAGSAGVVTTGKAVRKDADAMSAGSIMDIENILTTKSKDRDGDVLHPKGGKLDPNMPLLWQHLPTDPIGKMVQVLEQDENVVKTHFAIADVPLGRDAAVLVEFGALRFSHGFKPLKFAPLGEDEEGNPDGWDVTEYEVMEGSLVSVPANTSAVITAFSRNKLNAPLIKSWAKRLYDDRPVIVGFHPPAFKNKIVVGAGGVVQIGGTRTKPKAVKAAAKVNDDDPVTKYGLWEYKCPHCGGKAYNGDPTTGVKFRGSGVCSEDACGKSFSIVGSKMEPTRKSDDEYEKPKDPMPGDKDDGKKADGKKADKPSAMLSDVCERAQAMADDETLPNEVRARASVVAGILTDVGEKLAGVKDSILQAAEAQDIAGLMKTQDMIREACGKRLSRAADELGVIGDAGGNDIGDDMKASLGEMRDAVAAVVASMGSDDMDAAATGTNPEDDSTGNGLDDQENDNGDDELPSDQNGDDSGFTVPDESEDDEDDSELDEDEEGKAGDDEDENNDPFGDDESEDEDDSELDEDDSELEEMGKAGEDEDDEDDEPNGQKYDSDDENPGGEVDPDEDNPEVGKRAGKGKSADRVARELLANLFGGGTLDRDTKKVLRDALGD